MKTIEELKCSIVDINYVLENMIRENGLYCLLGEAKVGKSAMALQIANSVANGIPLLDLKTNKSPVLYLSTEMNPNETISRIKLMGLNLSNEDFLYTYPEDSMTQLSILKVEKEIMDFHEKYNGKLVFIDMFNGINFGYNYGLNNYQDMSQNIFPKIREFCTKYEVTIILVHHLNRKGKSLGSTAIDTCVDGKIAIKQDENIKSTFYLKYESRDYPGREYVLKRDDNLILSIDEITDDKLNENIMAFLRYAMGNNEFEFTMSDMINKLKLDIIPSTLGKLLASNKDELEKIGLTIKSKNKSKRLYTAKYEEPLNTTLDIFEDEDNLNEEE